MPGIAISVLCEFSHFIFIVALQVRDCYYLHFIGDKTKGHIGEWNIWN